MLAFSYKTKTALKQAKGQKLRYVETSMYGNEYSGDGQYTGVGPEPYLRKWYATVIVADGVIKSVK